MELKDWQRVEELFHEALLVEAPRRAAFLSELCPGDEPLRREVESLIAAFESERGFQMERPALSLGLKVLSPRPQELPEGETIGQYKIVRLLGEGGLGRVYLAEDDRLERPVALKFIASAGADTGWVAEQLTKEARAVAKLEHPNICAIHGLEEIGGHRFIVMQYVEGEPLDVVLHAGALDARRALGLAEQMADALSSAHARGVVHRDIKPQNVVITPAGKAKILDFGLAKLTRPAPATGQAAGGDLNRTARLGLVVGTVAYMSPEQSNGDEIDGRSDIFSLGVVLYEMLAGVNPFRRKSVEETLAAVREHDPPPLAAPAGVTMPELDRVVRRCLEKDRARRYEAADQLLRDLRRLREKLEGGAPPRRRLLAVSALALALLLAAFSLFSYRRLNRVHTMAVFNVAAEGAGEAAADLGAGLSRSLGYRLSRLSRLQVKAPKEATVAGKRRDELAAAARELGVEVLLVNEVRRQGESFVMHASLLDASDAEPIWEEDFSTGGTDLTSLLTRVTRGVAVSLDLRLSREDEEFLAKRQPNDPEAVEFYLRGQNYLNRRGEANVRQAIESFGRAVERDWVFAEAHAGLAESYLLLTTVAYGPEKTSDMIAMARASARQALKSDPTLSEAHTALGIIYLRYEWDWREAESALRRAIELNPDYAPARYWYSNLLMVLGRHEEALAQSERAQELEPFSPVMLMNVGRAHYYARRYDEAAARFSAMLQADSGASSALYMLGLAHLARGRYAEGINTLEKLYASRPLYAAAPLGFAYGRANRPADALAVLAKLDELSREHPVPAQERAIIYVGIGDRDKAFAYLEEAYRERFSSLNSLTVEPLFDDLRSDPRYTDLARRLNLKP